MSLAGNDAMLADVVFFQEGPGLRKWQWAEDGMKVINVTNILGDAAGTVDVTNTDKYISLVEFEEKYRHFAVDVGDMVVASSGNTYGKVGRITEQCLPLMMNTSVIRFHSLDSEKLNNKYLYVFLRSPDFRNQVEQFVTGGAQPNFGPTHLKRMKIPLPNISVQKRIGEFVAAYDDLIENNRRRIQLLEQSARLLYKEWFVHLRFPGHEHVKIKNGVPEGWERQTLTDLAESVSYGFTASSSQEEVGPKFLRITDIAPSILNWDEVPFCVATAKDIQRNQLAVGDVVVARTGATVGYAKRISYLKSQTVYASYLVRFRFHTPEISFIAGVFMESGAYKDHVRNHAGGAAQPNANAKVLGSAVLLIPPQILQDQFSDFIKAIYSQRDTLVQQNSRLSKARDLLLPRLMNGDLVV